jgi:hypothetical protein
MENTNNINVVKKSISCNISSISSNSSNGYNSSNPMYFNNLCESEYNINNFMNINLQSLNEKIFDEYNNILNKFNKSINDLYHNKTVVYSNKQLELLKGKTRRMYNQLYNELMKKASMFNIVQDSFIPPNDVLEVQKLVPSQKHAIPLNENSWIISTKNNILNSYLQFKAIYNNTTKLWFLQESYFVQIKDKLQKFEGSTMNKITTETIKKYLSTKDYFSILSNLHTTLQTEASKIQKRIKGSNHIINNEKDVEKDINNSLIENSVTNINEKENKENTQIQNNQNENTHEHSEKIQTP